MSTWRPCPICDAPSVPLDVVDFNRSCEEVRGIYLPLAGIPIHYSLCENCGFCFAPEMYEWTLEEFERKIYNDQYVQVDPDYVHKRPSASAKTLIEMFGKSGTGINHLDYGGGHGLLSDLMRDSGWRSSSYDPFVDRATQIDQLGTYDLITAFEVFEHVPDVKRLASELSILLNPEGIVLFSTLLSDGHIQPHQRLAWWYASPRNGHISLFSTKSLHTLAAGAEFCCASFSKDFHAFWRIVPPWAIRFLPDNGNALSSLPGLGHASGKGT
jgi:SAM-dependent methyltransferase